MDNVTNKDLFAQLQKMDEKIEKRYVTKVEFLPVRLVVYGAIALTLTKVASTGLSFVVDNLQIISLAMALTK